MSILRTYLDGFWRDVCQVDTRFRVGPNWFKVKNNDYVYVNQAWRKIICSYAYKWVLDPSASECEKSNAIVDVPIKLANPFVQYAQNFDSIAQTPGSTLTFKKNIVTGHYLFGLDWIYITPAGVGPGTYQQGFADGNPSYNIFTYTPIAQIIDPTLYPPSRIELSGIGNYNLSLRGHIDPQGRIWIDQAATKSITAWNPQDPNWHMRVFNNTYASDFTGVNPGINTGYIINHKYKKVTNDSLQLPLDVNNQLVEPGLGNIQDTIDVPTDDPNYRVLSVSCGATGTTYGNQVRSQVFTRNNCQGGTNPTSVTYTVPENTFYAPSVADANQLAQNDIDANGQNYANTVGGCNQAIFGNAAKSQSFIKNDCSPDQQGSSVPYLVPAYKYTASTQVAADQLAQDEINANGQANANTNGTCATVVFRNVIFSQPFTKQGCGVDSTGSTVTYTVAANTYSASTQDAANQLALDDISANGQNYANTNGVCNLNPVVAINYKSVMGLDPLTWVGLDLYKNGIQVLEVTYDTVNSQSFTGVTFRVGDTIRIQQFHFTNFPWAPASKGNLGVLRNNSTSVYNNDNSDPNALGLNDYEWTLLAGDTSIDITGTGSSTATGYLTRSLMSNNQSHNMNDVGVEIDDNTGSNIILNLNPELSGGSVNSYPFNFINDSGLLTVKIVNNGATTMSYSLTGEFGYSNSGTIAVGSTAIISNVPKGTVSLMITN